MSNSVSSLLNNIVISSIFAENADARSASNESTLVKGVYTRDICSNCTYI